MRYFSDKENGPRPRAKETIDHAVWGGIAAHILKLVAKGSFGNEYPLECPDGQGTYGTNEDLFSLTLEAQVPGIRWPLQIKRPHMGAYSSEEPFIPETLQILDLIEFCFDKVSKPLPISYHDYYGHTHFHFDVNEGRQEFRKEINSLFYRNGIAYELDSNGTIERLGPPVLGEALNEFSFATEDAILNQMLEEARKKFFSPEESMRREAVERLWDSWERIKTLESPESKKQSINLLLNKVTSDDFIYRMIEDDAKSLTDIGNSFQIRHTEMNQTRISDSDHLDYLFHRLFAMIQLLLRKRQELGR